MLNLLKNIKFKLRETWLPKNIKEPKKKKVKFNGVSKFKEEPGTPKEPYFIADIPNNITKINSKGFKIINQSFDGNKQT